MNRVRVAVLGRLACLALAACRSGGAGAPALPPLPAPAVVADTVRADTVAPGVVHRFYYMARGPWAVHVLDVDRAACVTAIAAKNAPDSRGAAGRVRTSQIAAAVAASLGDSSVLGAVNADFFELATGVPQAAFFRGGLPIAGPNGRPVFGLVGDDRRPWIGRATMRGRIVIGADTIAISTVNRADPRGVSAFLRTWGTQTDSATGAIEVVVREDLRDADIVRSRADLVDTLPTGVDIPASGFVLVAGRDADSTVRRRLLALPSTATNIVAELQADPRELRDAVGGRPVLLRSGADAGNLDSAGAANFAPVRHPRTAVGFDSSGRRLLFVTVDGRQPGYSDGMTLRELAGLMRNLGAHEALNLDGGGSTTMVVHDRGDSTGLRVVNRPSDKEGERTVGNALVVITRPRGRGARACRVS